MRELPKSGSRELRSRSKSRPPVGPSNRVDLPTVRDSSRHRISREYTTPSFNVVPDEDIYKQQIKRSSRNASRVETVQSQRSKFVKESMNSCSFLVGLGLQEAFETPHQNGKLLI